MNMGMRRNNPQNSKTVPWRSGLFVLLCLAAFPLMLVVHRAEAMLIGFDLAALAYMATLPTLFRLDAVGIREQAARVDPDRKVLLLLTAFVLAVILVAIATVLVERRGGDPRSILLCLTTLVVAWVFSNMVYTLHYAHLYYSSAGDGDRKGLMFPGTSHPDYADFAYFSFTLGMTFQP